MLLRLRVLSATMAMSESDPGLQERNASYSSIISSNNVPHAGVSLKPSFVVAFTKAAAFTPGSAVMDGGAYVVSRLVKEDRVCIVELQPRLMTLTPRELHAALDAGRRKGEAGANDPDSHSRATTPFLAEAPAVPCSTASSSLAPHVLRVAPAVDLRPGTLYALALFHLEAGERRLGVLDDWFIPFRTAPRPVPPSIPAAGRAAVAAAILSAFSCSICFEPCRNPVPTMCGHCFCRDHLNEWIASKQASGAFPTCPLCRAPLTLFFDPFLRANAGIAAAIAVAEDVVAHGSTSSTDAFDKAVSLPCTVCCRPCVEPTAAPCGHNFCRQHLDESRSWPAQWTVCPSPDCARRLPAADMVAVSSAMEAVTSAVGRARGKQDDGGK